ncbi:MAG: MATE family efflux transporter, partial [Spirochaetales bacterium]
MIDMTQGSPVKLITKFTVPLLLGNLLQQMYNVVDSIVVGNFVGSAALAAVGNSFIVMFLLFALFGGLGMGATILISQFLGANQKDKLKAVIDTMYIALLVGGTLVGIIGIFSARFFLELLNTPEGPVMEMSIVYLRTVFIGSAATFGYSINSGILHGVGDGKSPLLFW